jgi:hypothetical protein
MKKHEQKDLVRRRAQELAASGSYANDRAIELAFRDSVRKVRPAC